MKSEIIEKKFEPITIKIVLESKEEVIDFLNLTSLDAISITKLVGIVEKLEPIREQLKKI